MQKLLIPFLLFCCFHSFAQPVLTGANLNLVPGDLSYYNKCDTAGVKIDAGGPGHLWNYGVLAIIKTDTMHVVACSSTPYCDSFPAGSIAVAYSPVNVGYWVGNNDFCMGVGSHSDQVGYSYVLRQDTMKYPVSYPMSWNDTSLEAYDTTFASSHLLRRGRSIVDGYGTLILPSGTFTNVLRIHNVVYLTDSNFTGGSLGVFNYRTDVYVWYVPGYHFPLLSIEVDNDLVTGAIQDVYCVNYSSGPGIAKLLVVNDQVPGIRVYPNPANDVIRVGGLQSMVNYRLLNIVGSELRSGSLDAANNVVPVNDLASGIYMLEVSNAYGEKSINKIIKQ